MVCGTYFCCSQPQENNKLKLVDGSEWCVILPAAQGLPIIVVSGPAKIGVCFIYLSPSERYNYGNGGHVSTLTSLAFQLLVI